MTDLPAARRYDEKEVRRLLERASELQGAPPAAPPHTGLTLRELEEIAAEAGIDATAVRRAAAELDVGAQLVGGGPAQKLAGGPLRQVLELTLPGEADPASHSDLLLLIQRAADAPGQGVQVGRTFSWTSQNPGSLRQLQVMVAARDGATHIWIEERYTGLAAAVFGGGLGGIGGGLGLGVGGAVGGALGSVVLGIGIPVAVIAGTYAACRAIYLKVVTSRRRVLEQLLRDLAVRLAT